METMTLGSLFDGIGGWLLAARHAGVTPAWASACGTKSEWIKNAVANRR